MEKETIQVLREIKKELQTIVSSMEQFKDMQVKLDSKEIAEATSKVLHQ